MPKRTVRKKRKTSGTSHRRRPTGETTPRLRRRLLELLYMKAFRYNPRETFRLASGKTSPYYIDCKKVTLDPEGAYLVGRLVFDRIRALKPEGIGGLTLGADPIALAVSMVSRLQKQPVPAFIVRKELKGHGSASGGVSATGGWIEGNLSHNARVVVVDDVVTTGGSTLKAIDRLEAHGCRILKILALVDRHEGGTEAVQSRGYPLETLFSINDFLNLIKPERERKDRP